MSSIASSPALSPFTVTLFRDGIYSDPAVKVDVVVNSSEASVSFYVIYCGTHLTRDYNGVSLLNGHMTNDKLSSRSYPYAEYSSDTPVITQ